MGLGVMDSARDIGADLLEGLYYAWVAALPVSELRVAIPLAIHRGVPPAVALILGIVGNCIPIVPLLLAFEPITARLRSSRLFRKAAEAARLANLRKSGIVRAYGPLGLAVFVAVPFPGTGAWTGAMIASLLKLPFWSSVAAIAAGVMVSGIIVTVLTALAL
jgi:uncharacterized membrane protein